MAARVDLSDEELDRNDAAFRAVLPELLKIHRGKFVVIRDGALLDAFESCRDAYVFGWSKYEDERFSVQNVTDEPIYSGIFSYGVVDRPA
jgi:hypothetical protein